MTRICQCCNGTGIEHDDDLDDIRLECAEKGITILPGDRLCLRATADLVGVKYGTFRNWRLWKDIPLGETEVDGTVTYWLGDIPELRRVTGR